MLSVISREAWLLTGFLSSCVELTFPMGARILDVEQCDDDWWFGSYNGKSGMFPANHVRPS